MEKAKVYFSDLRTSPTSNLLDKMEQLPPKIVSDAISA